MRNKKKLSKRPLALMAEEALKSAVAKVIKESKRTDEPLAIWRDGNVVRIPANQIEVREAQADYKNNKRAKLKRG